MSLKNLSIATPFGNLRVTTFKRFLKLVPIRDVWSDHLDQAPYHQVPTQYGNARLVNDVLETTSYIPRLTSTPLVDPELLTANALEDLLAYAAFETCAEPSLESIYEAARSLACDMGYPEYLVRLASRQWSLLNPKDFVLLFDSGKGKSGLAVLKPYLARVWKVGK
jgi:hypothetical protein